MCIREILYHCFFEFVHIYLLFNRQNNLELFNCEIITTGQYLLVFYIKTILVSFVNPYDKITQKRAKANKNRAFVFNQNPICVDYIV